MNGIGDQSSTPDPLLLHLDALVVRWLQSWDERPGRQLSLAERSRVINHIAVLRRMTDESAGNAGGGDARTVLVDTGSGVLHVRDGSMDNLAGRLAAAGYPFTTRGQIARTWRQFERWLLREHAPPPAPGPIHPVSFTQDDIVRLVTAARSPLATRAEACPDRDQALVTVLLAAGPRSGELVALRAEDVCLDDLSIRVSTPDRPERNVPISPIAAGRIASYVGTRPDRRQHLFVRRDGRPLGPPTLNRIVTRLTVEAGAEIPGPSRVRAFRNTYIYRQVGLGVPPSMIAARLGASTRALTPYIDGFRPERRTDLDAALGEGAV